MSDNVTHLDLEETPEPKRSIVRSVLMIVVSVVVVLGLLAMFVFTNGFNLDTLRRWVKYVNVSDDGIYGSYTFDSHSSNQYASFHEGLAIASVSGLNVYDENGEELFVLQEQLDLPQIMTSEQLAVAYDVGGNRLIALHRRNGEVLRLEEKRPILDADLSSSGYLCLSSSASGYKSVLSVYNSNQELIYRWLSSTTYIPIYAIAPDGKTMAAIALGQQGGSFESTIFVFKTDTEEIQQTISLGNQLFYDLRFADNSLLYAIGESSVQCLNVNGQLLNSCSYGDQYLKDYAGGGDGFLAIATNMYKAGNRYSLMTVDHKGNKIAETYLGEELLDMSVCGKYIAVLTTEGLKIYTSNLLVYHETAETGNATAVLIREDGSVILLGNGQGRLYVP